NLEGEIMQPKFILNSILAVLLFSALAIVAFAQTDQGRIAAAVTDINGAIVPGASVTVTNQATGETRTVVVNDDGSFIVVNLKPGKYTVGANATNFEAVKKADIELLLGQQLNLELKLPAKG